jgi:nucleoside-diphosphate-sugar epimerase
VSARAPRRVLVAGYGYVGEALARRLSAAGAEVFALSRAPRDLPTGVRALPCDLSAPIPSGLLPGELDAVAYLAAPGRPAAGLPFDLDAAYRAIFVDGSRNLRQALEASGQRPRVIFASSTSVYGQDDGAWIDEDSPAIPADPRGGLVLAGEAEWTRGAGLPAVVVRLGGIYGPGRTRLLAQVLAGRLPRPRGAEATRFTNRIHRDDAAGLFAHLMGIEDPAPLYLGVDSEPASRGDLLAYLAELVGTELPEGPDEVAPAPSGGPPPRNPGSKRCSNARALASGYRFAFPSFREGYRALLAETEE